MFSTMDRNVDLTKASAILARQQGYSLTSSMSTNIPSHQILIDGFLESAQNYPNRPALLVNEATYTYAELALHVGAIAREIESQKSSCKLVGVLAHKSLTAYSGILGSLVSGCGYVPLQPKHPIDRITRSIEISGLQVIVVGAESLECLKQLLPTIKTSLTVVLPHTDNVDDLQDVAGNHKLITSAQIAPFTDSLRRPDCTPDDIAYIIFTSGSTGVPKGVPVLNRSATSFVRYMKERCVATPDDRFSQIADLTFDLSIFPIWTCWQSGACLCCVSDKDKLAAAKFVRTNDISVWTSVPSAVSLLKRMRLLKPNSLPSIRYSFFCGEPLPAEAAKDWQTACTESIVENMYGPSEATCAITYFTWQGDDSRCSNGIVPIGWPFETQQATIVDSHFNPVADGQEGELCLAGDQVIEGYLGDPKQTKEKFIQIPSLGEKTWYRTGDLALKEADGCYFFRGRIDFQVKVMGHRIELQEVEAAIRNATRSEMVVCLPWPIVNGAPQGLVGFFTGAEDNYQENDLISQCKTSLPEYMIPKRIHMLPSLPLSANGKIDRQKLSKMLEEKELT